MRGIILSQYASRKSGINSLKDMNTVLVSLFIKYLNLTRICEKLAVKFKNQIWDLMDSNQRVFLQPRYMT
jgi:hypothetical protein